MRCVRKKTLIQKLKNSPQTIVHCELDKSSVCANENEPHNVNGPVVVRLTTPASLVQSVQKTAVLLLHTLVPSTYLHGTQPRTQKTARFPS